MKLPTVPIIVAVVVVAAVGGLYFSGFELETQTENISEDSVETQLTGAEVADMTLGFVESTRDEEGDIAWFVDCGVGEECELASSDFSVDSSLLSLAYRDSGNDAMADSEFQRTIEACTAEGFCGVSSFDSILDSYERTGNEEHMQIVVDSESSWTEIADTNKIEDDLTYVTSSINLAKIYRLNSDESTLAKSKEILDDAKLRTPSEEDPEFNIKTVSSLECFVQNANIEYYTSSGDESYLNDAVSFFEEDDLTSSSIRMPETQTMIHCANALLSLGEITGDDSYAQSSEKLAVRIVTDRWDSDYSFVSDSTHIPLKKIEDSVRMVSLVSNFEDTVFVLGDASDE